MTPSDKVLISFLGVVLEPLRQHYAKANMTLRRRAGK